MTNNQTVDDVPREVTAEMLDELTNGDHSKRAVMKLRWEQMLKVIPAAQPHSEPVAWIKPDVAKTLRKDECCYAFGSQNPKGTLIPLYAGRTEDQ